MNKAKCETSSFAGALSASKPGRCEECRKKTGLMGITCRCGKHCCVSHIQSEAHNCTYDFRTEGMKALSTMMVTVIADKVDSRI